MNSKDNRKLLKEEKLDYILGTRLRNIKEIKEYLLSLQRDFSFSSVLKDKEGETILGVKEISLGGVRYLIGFNQEEAKREKRNREEIIKKLAKQLQEKGIKSLIKNRGYQRLLKVEKGTKETIQIDQEKLKQEEAFDGIFVCQTNTDLSKEEVVLQYKNLWIVERAFRRLKDILEVRPIYHQADRRIKGHVFISFLALYLEMNLRKRLQDQGLSSLDDNLRTIQQIKANKIRIKQKTAVLRTELPEKVYQIFQALNIRPPNRILEEWQEKP